MLKQFLALFRRSPKPRYTYDIYLFKFQYRFEYYCLITDNRTSQVSEITLYSCDEVFQFPRALRELATPVQLPLT